MRTGRRRVAVIFGGRSGEHEVSIESAQSVLAAIDRSRYDVLPIGVTQEGAWYLVDPADLLEGATDSAPRLLPVADPTEGGVRSLDQVPGRADRTLDGIDLVFPLIHGTSGEDGCLQGLFELASVPCVGSGVLGSAVGMDKIVMKNVFVAHGLPVVPHVALSRSDWERAPREAQKRVAATIGFPCFVKPANLGSSVGITKVHGPDELPSAITLAAEFSARVLVERAVAAREIECGVLGNDDPMASVVAEVIPAREFYDYEAKYHDPRTQFVIPADVPVEMAERVRTLASQAFRAIGAAGMARVDFFLDRENGKLYINEINTIPGFTSMSVYPRVWAASGVSYRELIDRLIQLALDRHADQARNRTRYQR